jgi:predicted outer membrane repeat protein
MSLSRRLLGASLAVSVLVSLVAAAGASPALGLSPTACRVSNLDTGVTKRNLAAAVAAASAGARLTVRGTCTGITTIDRTLRVTGIRPRGAGRPTLDGNDLGSVLRVSPGVTLRLENLTLTDGNGSDVPNAGIVGGGLVNEGTAVLARVIVRGNQAGDGGGIYNAGKLRLERGTVVSGNAAPINGAGIHNNGLLRMNASATVRGNQAGANGGGIYSNSGSSVRLTGDARIVQNEAGSNGGGIYSYTGTTLELRGRARIQSNVGGSNGGGAFGNGAAITLEDSASIRLNEARSGAGAYLFNATVLTLKDDASISRNTATINGGGIFSSFSSASTIIGGTCGTDPDGNIHDNAPQDCFTP